MGGNSPLLVVEQTVARCSKTTSTKRTGFLIRDADSQCGQSSDRKHNLSGCMSACQSLGLPHSRCFMRSFDEGGPRKTDDKGRDTRRLHIQLFLECHATLAVSPSCDTEDKMSTQTDRQAWLAGIHGGRFSMRFQWRARGAERRRIPGKVIRQGSLRSGDIHHFV